ncbi:MAG: Sua5/YciO/YrdC/YwlC family protein [bacterium]|nr:Sua5/YciO/YrdC/YwlC family protein [bacterium]
MKRISTPEDLRIALINNEVGLAHSDTILGIIALPTPENAARICHLKKRDLNMGFIIVLPNISHLSLYTANLPQTLLETLTQYWPAPLTAILPKHPNVSHTLTGNRDTIAIRIPSTHIPPLPIISTSANYSGNTIAWNPLNPPKEIESHIDFVYTPPTAPAQTTASTLVDFTAHPPNIIRQGAFKLLT